MELSNHRWTAAFLAVSVLFGGTFVAAKAGLADVPPLLLVAVRFDLAALVLGGYVLYTHDVRDLVPRTRGDIAGVLAAGVFAIGLANGLLFLGQGSVTSGVGAILFALVPIFTPLFAGGLLSDERLSVTGAVGTLVGLVGVGMVIEITPATLRATLSGGAAIVLAGAVSLALGTVLIRRSAPRLSSTVRTAWALPVSAALLHALSLGTGESVAAATWTPSALLSVAYLGVFAGALAYILHFNLLDAVGATRSSLVFYVSPIVATLGGWLLLGESLSAMTVAGFGVIVVGFGIIGAPELAPLARRSRHRLAEWGRAHGYGRAEGVRYSGE
ncbi:DMT family transporter [Halonotius sp. GCM10025705]|uniref:DMT family transporter n=1 Tax=Halonotius sp. GCM10025705 TaxID=3252678 RepID=UPI00360A34C2